MTGHTPPCTLDGATVSLLTRNNCSGGSRTLYYGSPQAALIAEVKRAIQVPLTEFSAPEDLVQAAAMRAPDATRPAAQFDLMAIWREMIADGAFENGSYTHTLTLADAAGQPLIQRAHPAGSLVATTLRDCLADHLAGGGDLDEALRAERRIVFWDGDAEVEEISDGPKSAFEMARGWLRTERALSEAARTHKVDRVCLHILLEGVQRARSGEPPLVGFYDRADNQPPEVLEMIDAGEAIWEIAPGKHVADRLCRGKTGRPRRAVGRLTALGAARYGAALHHALAQVSAQGDALPDRDTYIARLKASAIETAKV
ncbi:hypothetical protein CKO28_00185 [Rhodovibrio sodomensis]|uniref:Uncharacterized protein n=1 Tax=Rhodovibrio sodomensis TaxID=1088 RepID=A0ABS1D912_9PROT|nr:hypothetical protein [Rhodovibrio sodomensis]MBK1666457.1 hypothetical protein [Rhodovibrio sodomensis]